MSKHNASMSSIIYLSHCSVKYCFTTEKNAKFVISYVHAPLGHIQQLDSPAGPQSSSFLHILCFIFTSQFLYHKQRSGEVTIAHRLKASFLQKQKAVKIVIKNEQQEAL